MSVAALVLAAGRGSRFGDAPKLLAPFDGRPLVRHAVESALGSGLRPVLVVTGHRGEAVAEACRAPEVAVLHNPDHAAGQSTSLRAGFAALPATACGAVVFLGDMPRVRAADVARLIAAWDAAGRPAAAIPTYGGRRGNPVLLSATLAPDIARLEGDTGAGPLLRGRPDVIEVAMPDAEAGEDVDTPDALARLQAGGRRQASTTPSSTAP